MVSSKLILTLLTLIVFLSAQGCHQLCANCTSASCSSCYSNFSLNANISSSCSCPTGMFLNSTSSLCQLCPITCASCVNSTYCTNCSAGFMLSNSYTCIPAAYNSNNWVSKNISYELNDGLSLPANLQVLINDTVSTSYQINTTCSKMSKYSWMGGYGKFTYRTKIIKSTFNMPPHQWINIKLQAAIIDYWLNNTLILQINTAESYNSTTMESPKTIWSSTFSSSSKTKDFCGNETFADSLAVVDLWIPHNVSSVKFRIRMNQSDSSFNSTSNIYQAYFAIRELFIRVGTCGKNCIYCSAPNQCTQCVLPYTASNGSCICNSTFGFETPTGCALNCASGFYLNTTARTCLNCENLLDNCKTCNSTACSSCEIGYFYYSDELKTKCIRYCPTGFTEVTNYPIDSTNNQTNYRDQCMPCPSNCSTCNYNICLFCMQGFIYYQGLCVAMCPIQMYAVSGSCQRCPSNCILCFDSSTCKTCLSGFALVNKLCSPYCANTTLISSSSNVCNISCAASCSSCFGPLSTQCLSCSGDNYLLNNSCVPLCYAGYYQSGSRCISCPQQCLSCSNSNNCLNCTAGYYYYNSKCLRLCPASYYPAIVNSSNICSACQQGCERCKSNLFCQECKKNYVLFNYTCTKNKPSSCYHDREFLKIKSCQPNCLKCQKRVCYKCASGFYLDQGVCVAKCGPNKFEAYTSFYRNYEEDSQDSGDNQNTGDNSNGQSSSSQTGYCSWKSPSCLNYSNGICTQCKYFQPKLLPLGNDGSCLYNCPQFYVASTTGCVKCPQNCRRCTPALKCLECLYNYVINYQDLITSSNYQNSTCILHYCQAPYFSDSVQCQKCREGCSVCQIDGSCVHCISGYTFNQTFGICHLSSCSALQYSSGLSCAACVSPCLTCTSLLVCTSCISSNNTLWILNGSCVSACPASYFPHPPSKQCRKCNSKCLTCSSFYNCLTCASSFYLLSFYSEDQARCVAECPIGFWSDTAVCQSCYKDCKSCYGPSEYQCLTCYPNFVLDQWKCVYQCSIGKYKDSDGYCDWCDPSCLQCNGPTPDNCITCAQNYYLLDRICWRQSCPAATYLAIEQQKICERCQFGCMLCNSPQFCRFCTNGKHLYRGWCYDKCPGSLSPKYIRFSIPDVAYYDKVEGTVCDQCLIHYSTNCLSCDINSCRQCAPGLYLYRYSLQYVNQTLKQQCLTSCPIGTYISTQQAREIPECLPCQASCTNCSSYSNCFKCSTGFNLINGYCTLNCPSGSYLTAYANCSACASPCVSCVTNSYNCASCPSGYYLYYNTSSTFKTCVATCPSGYFADTASGWCSKCLPTCTSCSATNNCTQCVSGFTLSNGLCQNQTTTCPTNCQTCAGQNCLKCNIPFLLYSNKNTSTSTCVSSCPTGFYPSIYTCQACNSSCLACANTPNNCSSCQSGLYLFGQSCVVVCPVGFYASSTQQACQACPSNCINCQATICYTCQVGFYLSQGQCYSNCPPSTYPSVSTGQCFNCQTGCLTCSNGVNCTSCSPTYVLYNSGCVSNCPNTSYIVTVLNSSKCQPCSSPCYTCTDQSTCVSCLPNYILNGTICQSSCTDGYFKLTTTVIYSNQDPNYNFNTLSRCVACDPSCATCISSATNCQSCNSPATLYGNQCLNLCPLGTYLSQSSCIPCSPYCVSCIDVSICTVCSNNTVLYSNRCFSACPPGFYSQSQTNTTENQYVCQACSVECLTCTGYSSYECIACNASYYSNSNGSCVSQCPKGTYANTMFATCSPCPVSCASCSSATACQECISNYALTSTLQCTNNNTCTASNCQFCSANSQTQCAQCLPNFYLVNSTCLTSCPNATYPENGLCKNCSFNCLSCSSQGCQTCSGGYLLYQGRCVGKCPATTFASGGSCQTDPCLAYNSTSTCLICASPYLLYNSSLSAANTNTTCVLSCPTNTVQAGLYCVPCPLQCTNCISTSTCTNCSSTTYLYLGVCLYSCPTGTYAYNSVCQNCSLAYCTKCVLQNRAQACTSCDPNSGSFLVNGSCVLVCPTGTYGQISTLSCNNCSQGCNKCFNSTYCSICNNGTYLFLGQCLAKCPSGTYLGPSGCLPCSTGCLQCSSSTNCSMCQSSLNLFISAASSTCVTACQAGYYSVAVTSANFVNSNQFQCYPCVAPCLVCSSPTSCSQCISNHSLLGSSCIQNCTQGFYSSIYQTISINSVTYSTSICTPCSSICLTCNGSANFCTSCPNGYILSSNSCLSNCNSSTTYYSETTRQCNNCSASCFSCYGPGTDNCLSCSPPMQLYAGSCFADCPFGYYSTSAYVCQICSPVCASCKSSASNCTLCSAGLFLQQTNSSSTCVSSCLAGYYLNTTNTSCVPCHSSCLTCFGAANNQCLTCPTDHYIVNATCVPTCPQGTAPIVLTSRSTCLPCPSNCQSCTYSATTLSLSCNQCANNYYLVNGNCSVTCPTGTYSSLATFTCIDCGINGCQSCIYNSSLIVACTACQPSYYLIDGICVTSCPANTVASGTQCVIQPTCQGYQWNGFCLNVCPVGTYATNITVVANDGTVTVTLGCNNCSTYCKACVSDTICLLCTTGTYMYTNGLQSSCVASCPSNYYLILNVCKQCPSPCQNCQFSLTGTYCTSCLAGFIQLGSICYTACPTGYYQNGNQCSLCSSVCSSCTGNSTNCTACKNINVNAPSCVANNTVCLSNQYLSSNAVCSNCSSACLTCYGGSSFECSSCANSSNILINGVCTSSCPSGTTKNGTTCVSCPTNCLTCNLTNNLLSCTTCASPLILTSINGSNVCVQSCSSLNTATVSYIQVGTSCQVCNLTNCVLCTTTTSNVTQCITCSNNTYLYNQQCLTACPSGTAPSSNTCVSCPQSCLTCNSSTICTKCTTGYYLLNNKCVVTCTTGFYALNDTCIACTIANCINCSATGCQSCQQPYLLSGGQCTTCISGYYFSSGICYLCSSSCQTCSGSSTNCTTCNVGFILYSGSCISSCPTGFYATSSSCAACTVANCQTCTSAGCSSCNTGYVGVTVAGNLSCQNACPASTYLSTSTNTCISCSTYCATCTSSTSCTSCSNNTILHQGYCISSCPVGLANVNQVCTICPSACKACTSLINCTICSSGFTLSNGTCTVTPNTCPNGYYLNALGSCIQCFPTCNTCSGGNSFDCLTCFSGYMLVSGVCVQNCISGQYFNTASSTCQSCSSAFTNCVTCTSTACLSCSTNYIVSNGSCSLTCPNGTFLFSSTCTPCPNYCLSCTSSTSCSQCLNSSIILLNGLCYTTCPTQTYYTNNTCKSCYQTCLTCSGPSSSNCSSCITPYNLYNNTCLTFCPNSTYDSNYICLNCSTNCILCTDLLTCTNCNSGFYLINGTCRSTCPSGYYVETSSNRCLQCVSPCVTCTSRASCTSCSPPTYLSGNSCISNCTMGYYSTITNNCTSCLVNNCLYCTSTSCSSCISGYYSIYMNGALKYCQPACIDGTFTDNSTMNCSSCFDNCKVCTNSSWCNICSTGYYTLSLAGTSSNQCVQTCPTGYFPNNTLLTCAQCRPNCYSCNSYPYCTICNSNYYLLSSNTTTSCVNSCPVGYYTPTSIDGTGSCGQCASDCFACVDASNCTKCISSSSVIVSGACTPSNCVDCLSCFPINNTCTKCIPGYFLFNSGCRASCPDRYYADNVTQTCISCISNCLLCETAEVCLICNTNYVFVNGTGCQNAGLILFGVLGNMSGFTSNITKIMAITYVATSSLPIGFGAMGSTYGPMQLCQSLYLLQGSSGGNEEMSTFLNSLSAASYTDNSGTSDQSNSSATTSRLLTAVNYRASFLQTNYPIFIIMLAFVAMYIFVLVLEKYNNSWCASCPNLQQYLGYTCQFMKKRFKWIYVDSILWISFMPFLYFAILQLQSDFSQSILSSLLAIIIIIVYPLYPLFILRKLFDRSSNPAEDLANYKAITLKQPPRPNNKTLCEDVTCCAKEDSTIPLIQMSLSPYIDKVVRPIYNQFDPEYSEFRYFKLEHWRLAYAPIKYIRKIIFVFIVALCPNPVTTLSLLVVVTTIYILYLVILRPKEKLYLILQLILESLLLFFIVFMLMYVTQGGATVSALSVATHAIGFLLANSTLAIAIILNLMSYYTIFCCVVDLIRHLRVKKMEDDQKEKNFNDMLEEKDKFEIGSHQYQDPSYVFDDKERQRFQLEEKQKFNPDDKQNFNDKEAIGIRKSNRRRGDDQATEENDQEQHYVPYDLDEKEFNVRSSVIRKKKTFEDEEQKPEDFTNLRETKKAGRRQRKKSIPIPAQDSGINSEEAMAHSTISNDPVEEIKSGLLKNRNSKYKRQLKKEEVGVEKGQLKQSTDKYRKRRDKQMQPSFQDSLQGLAEPEYGKKKQKKVPYDQFVIDVDTHDRIAPNKQSRGKKQQQGNELQQAKMKQREANKKSNDLRQGIMFDRQGKMKNSRSEKQKDLDNANTYDRNPKKNQSEREKQLDNVNTYDRNSKKNPSQREKQLDNLNTYDRNPKKNQSEREKQQLENLNTYDRNAKKKQSEREKQLEQANTYDRQGKLKKEEKEKELQNVKLAQRLKKQKENPFGQFDQIFPEQRIKDINTKDRQNQRKNKGKEEEQFVEPFVPETALKERQRKKNNIPNLHYKGSDQEQITVNEGKVVETKNKYKRNIKKPENQGAEVDINAIGKDIRTKKVDRMASNKEFAQDAPEELNYKERQGKQIQKKQNLEKGQNQKNVEQALAYNRQKRLAQKRQQKAQEPNLIPIQTKGQEKRVSNNKKPNIFNDFDDNLVDSVEFKQEVKKERRRNERDDDFEQQNMAKILKQKQQKPQRAEDKRLQVSQNLQESYEDAVRKNKQQIFKNISANRSNLLQIGGQDEFEQVNYERPESKIERPKSRNKDLGLGVNSRQNSEASDNQSRDIRKQRNSALIRQRKRGQLNINDGEQSDDNQVGQDSRRVSRINKPKSKLKSVLNIEDKSDAEDVQNIIL